MTKTLSIFRLYTDTEFKALITHFTLKSGRQIFIRNTQQPQKTAGSKGAKRAAQLSFDQTYAHFLSVLFTTDTTDCEDDGYAQNYDDYVDDTYADDVKPGKLKSNGSW